MKTAVIGAGPAGLTVAYQLSKQGHQVDVYEASSQVGGLSGSFALWGQQVDWGPHRFFCHDKQVNAFWLEVVGNDYHMVKRLTRIFYRNRFFLYPIQLLDACINLGPWEAARCLLSYMKEGLFPVKQDGSFETWVQHRFGRRLYEIFFKTYSEKLWGIPCTQLDVAFASQRIKQLSLLEALQHAVSFRNTTKHATLVDAFAYPLNGSGSVYSKMADFITMKGNRILLDTPVEKVLTKDLQTVGIELSDGTQCWYDTVVSTMPYTTLVKRMEEAPTNIKTLAEKLTYRNTRLVYLRINTSTAFPDNWIYMHSKELHVGRITNFRNWSPALYGEDPKTILAMEYWCNEEDERWLQPEADLINLAKEELVATGLVEASLIEAGYVLSIPLSYPVYTKGYTDILKPIIHFTQSIKGLYTIGRNGSFKYNNQDHSILMGLLTVENITGNKQHDLHAVNTDYGNYQESHNLDETGLQSATPDND